LRDLYARRVDQLVQIVGALLILAGFAAVQFERMRPDSRLYLALNLVGSAILAVLAWVESQWGFLLLETVWAIVSAWGLSRLLFQPRS
jgi:protein-S-isoprenylcysteine O-methyltransferase Ste14